jgi:hypothetical protein
MPAPSKIGQVRFALKIVIDAKVPIAAPDRIFITESAKQWSSLSPNTSSERFCWLIVLFT